MSTPKQESALAFDENSLRDFLGGENPELTKNEPAGTPVVEPEEKAEPEEPLTPEETAEPEEPAQETTLADDLQAALAPDPAIEEKAKADAAKAEELAKAAEAAKAAAPVHTDLEDIQKNLDPHTKPKTRKIIEQFKTAAIAERTRAAKLETEQAALKKQVEEMGAQLKAGKPPEDMVAELTTLRDRIRELDATKDPAIEAKYDKPINENTDATLAMLAERGIFSVLEYDKDGKVTGSRPMNDKEKAQATTAFKANGVSIRTMAQNIKRLEAAGDVEGAEQLRDLARENDRLAREKNAEITSIKGNYQGRVEARTKEQQAQQEQIAGIARTTSENTLKADIAELAKSFPAINPPPEPLATDSAAVVASKKAAIAEYGAVAAQVTEAVKVFNGSGLPADKAAAAQGRMAAAAVQAVILKSHVLPRMVKENTALAARVKELEGQVGKFRNAGGLNRAHAAAIQAAPAGEKNAPNLPATASFADSLRETLKSRGVDVNS